jgi:acyl carrier protein
MTKEDALATLTTVFRDVFDDEDLTITDETTADDIPDWDSLANIDLVSAVEKKFGIKLTTREISELRNVGDMIRAVMSKVG